MDESTQNTNKADTHTHPKLISTSTVTFFIRVKEKLEIC